MCLSRHPDPFLPRDQVSQPKRPSSQKRPVLNVVRRRLTIEEVSVIFDTGRLGNASAATAQFQMDRKTSVADSANDTGGEKPTTTTIEHKPFDS